LAKSRSSKKKAKAKTKTARKPARRKPRPKAPPTHIELRTIRQFAERHIALIDAQAAPHPKALEAKDRMRQWLADIEGSCGPDMSIPLG
jgi:hypothetical protein